MNGFNYDLAWTKKVEHLVFIDVSLMRNEMEKRQQTDR